MKSISPEGTQRNVKEPRRVSQRVPSAKKIHPDEVRGSWWNMKTKYGLARRVPSTKTALKAQVPRKGGKKEDKLKENDGYPEDSSRNDQKEGTVDPKGQTAKSGTSSVSCHHNAKKEIGSHIITPEIIRSDVGEAEGVESPAEEKLPDLPASTTAISPANHEQVQLLHKEQVQDSNSQPGRTYTSLQNPGYDFNQYVNSVPNYFTQPNRSTWHTDPFNYNYNHYHYNYNNNNPWTSSQYPYSQPPQQPLQYPTVERNGCAGRSTGGATHIQVSQDMTQWENSQTQFVECITDANDDLEGSSSCSNDASQSMLGNTIVDMRTSNFVSNGKSSNKTPSTTDYPVELQHEDYGFVITKDTSDTTPITKSKDKWSEKQTNVPSALKQLPTNSEYSIPYDELSDVAETSTTVEIDPVKIQKRKRVYTVALTAANKAKDNSNLHKKRGPHKFIPRDKYLPDFEPEFVRAMKTGTKMEVANRCDELVSLVVKDMGIHNGTGNTRYYAEMRGDLVTEFPNITENACLRNKVRKLLKPGIDNAKLSEDSEEDVPLKVPKGDTRRRTHPNENFLGLFTKLVARKASLERKKDTAQRLVGEVTASWKKCEKYKMVIPERYSRVSVTKERHEKINEFHTIVCNVATQKERNDSEYQEAYRYTWPLRTKAMIDGRAKFDRLLRVYPLLLRKSFLDLEVEEYFCKTEKKSNEGPNEECNEQSLTESRENTIREARKRLACFKFNVDLTWRAIGLLDDKNTPEANFLDYLSVMGESFVQFVQSPTEAKSSVPSLPYVVVLSRTGQVVLKFGNHEWLDIESLPEALGYAILLMTVFDMPFGSRSQLMFLLESLFFNYKAPGISRQTFLFGERLRQLVNPEEATTSTSAFSTQGSSNPASSRK